MPDTIINITVLPDNDNVLIIVPAESVMAITVEDSTSVINIIEGSNAAGPWFFPADFTVRDVTQGIYAPSDVIAEGTAVLNVVQNMLQSTTAVSYFAPTLSLSGTVPNMVEIGTSIQPTLTPTWTQNDAGTITRYYIKRNNLMAFDTSSAQVYIDNEYIATDTPTTYRAYAEYGDGPVKNNSMGTPDPNGRVLAGTVQSNQVSYVGARYLWYDKDVQTLAVADSAEVRTLTGQILNAVNGTAFTLVVPAGTRRITLAYPASLGELSSFRDVVFGEAKDVFTLTYIEVEGADGYSAITYNVYTYIASVPYSSSATYEVII